MLFWTLEPWVAAIAIIVLAVVALLFCFWIRECKYPDFVSPIQALLKERGLRISERTVKSVLKDIDECAPWFAVSGDLNLPCWEKLGRDLDAAKANQQLKSGTLPLWRVVHACLRDGKHVEHLKKGRRALAEHQDSLSESSSIKEGGNKKQMKKSEKGYKRGSEKQKETDDKSKHKKHQATAPSAPIYPSLDEFYEEFAALSVKQERDSGDDSLTEDEEEELEEEAARYEEERYGLPPPARAPPPPYPGKQNGGAHRLSRKTLRCLAEFTPLDAVAFPVFENQNQQRYHEPIPYKQLKDLVEAARTWGPNAQYTLILLDRITTAALTPNDWWEIARACLNTGQYLDYRAVVTEAAHNQARVNARTPNTAPWTADMLLGQGQWADNQTAFPVPVYQQIVEIFKRAWRMIPKRGEVSGNLTKIIQGPNEPFSDFVARMIEAAGKIFGDAQEAMPLVQQLVYEQCTKDCQRAITPWKGKGLDAWLKACREIGGPLTNEGLARAMIAATKHGRRDGCFICGQPGHVKRNCPNKEGFRAKGPNTKQPGTCPRCKKGKHWANECRSTKDINGQPINNPYVPESKNMQRGPRPQGPKIYGAFQEGILQPPRAPDEPRQAPRGWTSAPPPDWF